MVKISQYPKNADGTPMDLEVGVLVDATGNGGARLANVPVGPDGAPIDAIGLVMVDPSGNFVDIKSPFLNVKSFGATGNGVTDDTAAIQAALDASNALVGASVSTGGATVFFPAGTFIISGPLRVYANTHITGAGRTSSWIKSSHAGTGIGFDAAGVRAGSTFYSQFPINASTAANIEVDHVGIENTNAGNRGAGFYDTGGSYIHIHDCEFRGHRSGIIFDQSELCDVDFANINSQIYAGVWIVTGDSLTAGAFGEFTNRISVKTSQFNEAPTAYGILDDGGDCHSFEDNNYNGCKNCIRASGVGSLRIRGGEWEGGAEGCLKLEYRREHDLAGVGGCTGASWKAGFATPSAGQPLINIISGSIEVGGGLGFSTSVTAIQGTVASADVVIGWVIQTGVGAISDGYGTNGYDIKSWKMNFAGTLMSAKAAIAVPGNATITGDVRVDGAGGTARYVKFYTAGVDSGNYIALGGSSIDMFFNAADVNGTQNFSVGGVTRASVYSGGLSVTGTFLVNTTGGNTARVGEAVNGYVHQRVDFNGGPEVHIRPSAGKKGMVTFTEDAVADRWSYGIKPADGNLYWSAGDSNLGTIKMTLSAAGNLTLVGTITATNISGTNTGDQFTSVAQNTIIGRVAAGSGAASALTTLPSAVFPAFTGDVTTVAGNIANTIAANAVTYAKFQQVAANSLVGNPTGSLANAQGITLAGGLAFSGTTLTAAGALTPTSVAATGVISSSGGAVGYATGAGGAITQITSRATAVILNKLCGNVTLFNTTTAAGQFDKFTLTNSQILANDVVNVCVKTATANYIACVLSVAAGSCVIGVYTPAAVGAAEAPVLNFTISRAVNA